MRFEVDDIELVVRQLRDHGIVFEEYDLPGVKTVDGIATHRGARGAWFKDPDGNILQVGQYRSDTAGGSSRTTAPAATT